MSKFYQKNYVNLMIKYTLQYGDTFQIELEFGIADFRGEGETGVTLEKPLVASTYENQQQTQPTYNAESGN